MKPLTSLIIFFLISFCLAAQNPDWLWAQGTGGTRIDINRAVTSDAQGNVFTTGYFNSDSLPFASNTIYNSSASAYDCHIVKYDPAGNALWAQRISGTHNEKGRGLVTDNDGNLYIIGKADGTAVNFGTITLPSNGECIFLAKYDPAGNLVWAQVRNGLAFEEILGGNNITIDDFGHIYITGYLPGGNFTTVVFGNDTLIRNTLGHTSFIAQLDTAGNGTWGRVQDGDRNEKGYGIACDPSGNIYVTGTFDSDTMTAGNYILANATQTPYSSLARFDFFMVKYDPAGNVIWAQRHGGLKDEFGTNVSANAAGQIGVTGYFSSDTLILGVDTLFRTGPNIYSDLYICKYDSSGNLLWARSAASDGEEYTTGAAIGRAGDIWASGFSSSLFMQYGNDTVYGRNFIAHYDSSGNFIFAKGVPGVIAIGAYGLNMTDLEDILIAGGFGSPLIHFGPYFITEAGGQAGDYNGFVAKLGFPFTKVGEKYTVSNLRVFPDPSTGNFSVCLPDDPVDGKIQIFSSFGQLYLDKRIQKRCSDIEATNFSSGIYFIRVTDGNKNYFSKIVIE